jgi:hypothetical protein
MNVLSFGDRHTYLQLSLAPLPAQDFWETGGVVNGGWACFIFGPQPSALIPAQGRRGKWLDE